MAKDQNTFAKRAREMEKRRKAEEKRERRKKKKHLVGSPVEVATTDAAEDPVAEQ
jgi:hypothetical protein